MSYQEDFLANVKAIAPTASPDSAIVEMGDLIRFALRINTPRGMIVAQRPDLPMERLITIAEELLDKQPVLV